MNAYASAVQLAAFWRTLTTAEATRADVLLNLASNRLRQIADDLGIDLDTKVNASEVFSANAQWVVMEAVKRAMLMPTDAPPANRIEQGAGPYSENIIFANPAGDLWFKKTELRALNLYGKQTLDSITSTPRNDIYGS